jgi:excisionase family DNA binding protein
MHTLLTVLNHMVPALLAIQKDLETDRMELSQSASVTNDEHKQPQGLPRRHLLSMSDASRFLSISKTSLYRLTSQRQIPHYKIGGKVLFTEAKLWEWLEQRAIAIRKK